jgi:outer membrane receptor protein involved in Fe transport
MMNRIRPVFWILALLVTSLHGQGSGQITGRITDLDTHQPLLGANVMLEGTELGAATDGEGTYRIANLAVGSYAMRVTMMGYKSQSRGNVHVVSERSTVVNITLEPAALEIGAVMVTAGYFERAKNAMMSTRSMDIEEIRSDPVGAYDIIMMMHSLPSVASGGDHSNEIVIRGGGPGENLFVMDHLEIPYPNHFPQQGLSGGAIVGVNTEFVETIDFFAGAIPAQYGDKLSSVMDVTLREGSREKHQGEVSLGMGGLGGFVEGPLADRGSYMVSLSRSFIDVVAMEEVTGVSSAPIYATAQGKAVLELDNRRKLTFNFLGMLDEMTMEGDTMLLARGIENTQLNNSQYTVGVTYKNLFSEKGYSIMSLGQSRTLFDMDVYKLRDGQREDTYIKDNVEHETILKGDWYYLLSDRIKLSGGVKLKRVGLDYEDHAPASPTVRYGYTLSDTMPPALITRDDFYTNYYGNPDTVVTVWDTVNASEPWERVSHENFMKAGIYGQVRWRPMPRLELILGGRAEMMSLTGTVSLSPRASLSYNLTDRLEAKISAGRCYQTPVYDKLVSGTGEPESLDDYRADQAVAGLEYLLREDLRLTVEGYAREYDRMAIMHSVTTADTADLGGGWVNAGEGYARGVEIFLQKKFSNQWYGTFSFSKSEARGYDPRYPDESISYPWDYDFRDAVSLIGGYKIRYLDYDWYRRFRESIWVGMLSWLPVMPADEFEASFRLRYVGGAPYTPKVYDHNIRQWTTTQAQRLNTARYDPYLRVDIMFNKRFYYDNLNMVFFMGLNNVFNRNNPQIMAYLEDGSEEMLWQFKQSIAGGMMLEF